MKPQLYTYFEPIPGIQQFHERQLIMLWRRHWNNAGFETCVLNQYIASQHPYFREFTALAERNLPSINPAGYDLACWHRWLALAHVGGGWMADYDVFPTKPEDQQWVMPRYDKLLILQTPCCPCLVHCTPDLAERFVSAAAPGTIGRHEINGKPHYSDQYSLEALVIGMEPWIETRDVVKLWSDHGWEQAPVVHYSNSVCQPAGKMPRWQHIPGMLKP